MENFSGYILRKNIPQQKTVIQFAQKVKEYLFPILNDLQTFKEEQTIMLRTIEKELQSIVKDICSYCPCNTDFVTSQFIESLPEIREKLIEDAKAILQTDPSAYSMEEVFIAYPGFAAILAYRIAHKLYTLKLSIVPRIITEWAHSKTGIDINPGAQIDTPCIIDHGTGIVIGETTVIGKNVRIYQGVTLGALAVDKATTGKRHPTIEDNVILYANSTILGGETVIGHDSIIGGNCFITQSVPPQSLARHEANITVRKIAEKDII